MAGSMAWDLEQVEAAVAKEIVGSETPDFEIRGELNFFQHMTTVTKY
jgi:hypothetical protein